MTKPPRPQKQNEVDTGNRLARALELGVQVPADLQEEIRAAATGFYQPSRIGIFGKPQVGKSSLLNHAFLGSELLPVGDGLATSSALLELRYGAKPRLLLYPPAATGNPKAEPGLIIKKPAAADFRRYFMAEHAEQRGTCAAAIDRGVLEWPDDALDGLVFFDTPGFDDPKPGVLGPTTDRLLTSGNLDLAVLVAGVQQLDASEQQFLRRLHENGITHLLVLVSYNPATNPHSAKSQSNLLAIIRAQVEQQGVAMTDDSVQLFTLDRGNGNPAIPAALDTPDKIKTALRNFTDTYCQAGRRARLRHQLKTAIARAAQSLVAEINASNIAMQATLQPRQTELDASRQHLQQREAAFMDGFADFRQRVEEDVRDDITRRLNLFVCNTLSQFDTAGSSLELRRMEKRLCRLFELEAAEIWDNAEDDLKFELSQFCRDFAIPYQPVAKALNAPIPPDLHKSQSLARSLSKLLPFAKPATKLVKGVPVIGEMIDGVIDLADHQARNTLIEGLERDLQEWTVNRGKAQAQHLNTCFAAATGKLEETFRAATAEGRAAMDAEEQRLTALLTAAKDNSQAATAKQAAFSQLAQELVQS